MSDITNASGGTGIISKFIALGGAAAAAAEGFTPLIDAQAKYDAALAVNTVNAEKAKAAQDNLNASRKAGVGATESLAEATQKLALNTQLATDAQNGNTTSFKEGIGVQGQATLLMLTLAKATDEETKSLQDLLKAQNAYSAAVEHTMTVAQGWTDYLAELKASYDTGGISVLSYKRALEDFATQLEQTFGTATGKAKDALESMIGVINQLIATAGQGGQQTDFSVTGALNKAFNKP